MAEITQTVSIAADAEKIYQAITTQKGMEGWWTRDCSVREDSAEFRFEGGAMAVSFRRDDAKPSDRVHWTCVSQKNNPEWQDTTMLFELSSNGKETEVSLVHGGWKKAGTDTYNMCVGGWEFFMNSLKGYVETGEGTPHDK